MEKKYTSGPWFAIQYANQWCIQCEDGYEGADSDVLDEEFTDNAEANARLIAAAPDMFETLEAIAEDMNVGEGGDSYVMRKVAREMINKIKGGTKP